MAIRPPADLVPYIHYDDGMHLEPYIDYSGEIPVERYPTEEQQERFEAFKKRVEKWKEENPFSEI